jgi:plasmid stability protein
MATLHVRNVPDELYESLRDCAEREGRSIGAQAVVLLGRALSDREARLSGLRRSVSRRRSPFLQRFGEAARELVLRAQEHARELASPEVTPGHVLLAMLEDDVLRAPLERAGVTEEKVRASLPTGEAVGGQIPFSAETKQLLEQALRASLATKSPAIAPEHLAGAVASHFHVRGSFPSAFFPEPEEPYLAVRLEGDWTAQLNGLAADGWELFSVVPAVGEVRAIFRRPI